MMYSLFSVSRSTVYVAPVEIFSPILCDVYSTVTEFIGDRPELGGYSLAPVGRGIRRASCRGRLREASSGQFGCGSRMARPPPNVTDRTAAPSGYRPFQVRPCHFPPLASLPA